MNIFLEANDPAYRDLTRGDVLAGNYENSTPLDPGDAERLFQSCCEVGDMLAFNEECEAIAAILGHDPGTAIRPKRILW